MAFASGDTSIQKVRLERLMLFLSNIIAVIILAACSSSGIRIESEPSEATVQLKRPQQSPTELGKTPFELDLSTLPVGRGDLYRIAVVKNGYEEQSVLLSRSLLPQSGNVFFSLQEKKEDLKSELNASSIRKLSRGIANVQNYLNKKDYPQAEQLLIALISEYPSNSVLYDLLGNVHYLKKDYARALSSYKRSKELDPSNIETNRMIDVLESVRAPALEVPR